MRELRTEFTNPALRCGNKRGYIHMKKYLLLASCLILAGCTREAEHQREIITKLDALKTDLAAATNSNPPPLRWACANKSDINTVIYQWTAAKADDARAAEKLSPDMKAKVDAYEVLANQLNQMRISHSELMRPPMMMLRPGQAPEELTALQKEYNELSKKVAEAKQPIADIIDRRNRESMQLNQKYSVENIVAEYAKGKYDIVVESSYGGRGVLYSSSGDILDITQSVINYFKDKQK
jgi:hypothetical protein